MRSTTQRWRPNVVTQLLPLIDGVTPVTGKVGRPRKRPERRAVLGATARDHGFDAALPRLATVLLEVIATVSEHLRCGCRWSS